jgi:hypothetical protein
MTTTTFLVILEGSVDGCACMTTRDTFEAATADEAEALAVAAWSELEPTLRFAPLFTAAQ